MGPRFLFLILDFLGLSFLMNVSHDFKHAITSYIGLPRFSEKVLSCLFLKNFKSFEVM